MLNILYQDEHYVAIDKPHGLLVHRNAKTPDVSTFALQQVRNMMRKKIYPIQSYFPAPGSSESYYHLYLGEIQAFNGERIKGLEKENEDILVKSFKIDEVSTCRILG